MNLSDKNRKILLTSLHQAIEENANHIANHVFYGRENQLINYPPNGGLTEREKEAIKELQGDEDLKSALRKILASNTADVFFHIFNIIDGTSDPERGDWTGVAIVDISEEDEGDIDFLHDDFYGTYWDWRKVRKNKNWKLDLLDD